jgi:hypothetical protein
MVFPWRYQNSEPRPQCATCPVAASTWTIKGNIVWRFDAAIALGGTAQVRPSVPNSARRADRSCEVVRQCGVAGRGADGQLPAQEPQAARAVDSGSCAVKTTIHGAFAVRLRIIPVCAMLMVFMVFPWRYQNSEPRPQCATCPVAASTWTIKGNIVWRFDAAIALGGSV